MWGGPVTVSAHSSQRVQLFVYIHISTPNFQRVHPFFYTHIYTQLPESPAILLRTHTICRLLLHQNPHAVCIHAN